MIYHLNEHLNSYYDYMEHLKQLQVRSNHQLYIYKKKKSGMIAYELFT